MAEEQTTEAEPARPTRFARRYSDGTLSIERPSTDFFTARRSLVDGHDDDDVEILEVELRVVRSYGSPLQYQHQDRTVTCPTCGEEIRVADPALQPIRAGIQEWMRKSGILLRAADVETMLGFIAQSLGSAEA